VSWIDLHIDTAAKILDLGADPLLPCPDIHVDIPRMERAGVRAAVWASCVEDKATGDAATTRAMRMMLAARDLAFRSGGRVRLVLSPGDLEGTGVGMILGLEGADALQGRLGLLTAFHAAGLRVLTLTWNHSNAFACGCRVEPDQDGGLSEAGERLIARAQALGVVLDLAHASPRTLGDALARLRRPFLVSHTGCAALRSHRRNLSDGQLELVARAGGVIGICAFPGFTGPRLDDMAAHVAHAVSIAGVDSVAIGTDFDGITSTPEGLGGIEALPRLSDVLRTSGLNADVIEKVTWRNAHRVLREGLDGKEA